MHQVPHWPLHPLKEVYKLLPGTCSFAPSPFHSWKNRAGFLCLLLLGLLSAITCRHMSCWTAAEHTQKIGRLLWDNSPDSLFCLAFPIWKGCWESILQIVQKSFSESPMAIDTPTGLRESCVSHRCCLLRRLEHKRMFILPPNLKKKSNTFSIGSLLNLRKIGGRWKKIPA